MSHSSCFDRYFNENRETIKSIEENNKNFKKDVCKVEYLSDLLMYCNINSSIDKSNFQTEPKIIKNELNCLRHAIYERIQERLDKMQLEIEAFMKFEIDGMVDKDFIENIEITIRDLEEKIQNIMSLDEIDDEDDADDDADDDDEDDDDFKGEDDKSRFKSYTDDKKYSIIKQNNSINYFDHINDVTKLDANNSDSIFRMMTIISQIIITNNNDGISLDAAKPFVDWITRKKMKVSMKASWSRFQHEHRQCEYFSCVELLLKFLKREFEIAERMLQESSDIDKDLYYFPNKSEVGAENIHIDYCEFCYGSHSIIHCPDILNENWDNDYVVVKMKNMCLNCLKMGHTAANCKERKCSICHEGHNNLLHQFVVAESSSPKIFNLNQTFSKTKTINAEIEHKGRKVNVKFLIDCGSEVIVVSESQ